MLAHLGYNNNSGNCSSSNSSQHGDYPSSNGSRSSNPDLLLSAGSGELAWSNNLNGLKGCGDAIATSTVASSSNIENTSSYHLDNIIFGGNAYDNYASFAGNNFINFGSSRFANNYILSRKIEDATFYNVDNTSFFDSAASISVPNSMHGGQIFTPQTERVFHYKYTYYSLPYL